MTKPERQVMIDFVVSRLKVGEHRATILSKFGKKWQINVRTFDRILKAGKEQLSKEQAVIKEEIAKVDKAAAIKTRKRQIADADERKEVLTKIIRGQIKLKKPMAVGSKLKMITVAPDWQDRKNAIAELNKMEGDYAATKGEFVVNTFLDFLKESSDE